MPRYIPTADGPDARERRLLRGTAATLGQNSTKDLACLANIEIIREVARLRIPASMLPRLALRAGRVMFE
jgi:hypothetical protein